MWTGSPRKVEQVASIPWRVVEGLGTSPLKGATARLTQLNVAVRVDGRMASLEATVLGWGIGGLYSPPTDVFDRILSDLEMLRRAQPASTPELHE